MEILRTFAHSELIVSLFWRQGLLRVCDGAHGRQLVNLRLGGPRRRMPHDLTDARLRHLGGLVERHRRNLSLIGSRIKHRSYVFLI